MKENKLPIKVVPTLEQDFYKPDAGGGPKKVFGEVTRERRQGLSAQVSDIKSYYTAAFRVHPDIPAVARVRVRPDAIAKSHRPSSLLSTDTCPVIGVEGMGELLVSVTPSGLDRLANRIERDETKTGLANISTLLEINPYPPSVEPVEDDIAKVKLFSHHDPGVDAAVDRTFRGILARFGLVNPIELRYGKGLKIFSVTRPGPDLIEVLRSFVGVQSVGPFPIYQPVRSAAIPVRTIVAADFPLPRAEVKYPVVGIIDSGTSPSDPFIDPWRVAREVYVPPADQDNSHGSFVAGLVVNGRSLNHDDASFPSCSAKFVDIVALGSNTREDELLTRIEDALGKHQDVKVWNLSLGTDATVDDRAFSDFAVALDRLQDQFGVTFILAAGNYLKHPYRGWPPDNLGDADRICAPADSVRSVVVGSIAHREHATSRVKSGDPSPFSRRGPGPLYLPKPEISHLGGNCSSAGAYSQIGVLSTDGRNNVAEDIGTSFAAPLVTGLFAHVNNEIVGGNSQLITRALLVHAAALQAGKLDPHELRYRGFGTPPDWSEILACESWACTMIFDFEVPPKVCYEKAIFPMPPSLFAANDVLKANILMTLVHQSVLDASFGSEYCRSNIDVSLGTYLIGKDGKYHQVKQVPADPALTGSAYETDLVRHGFKWSPVKVYRREMVRGVSGAKWRLDLSLHHRSGFVPTQTERAVLVITVADPARSAPVYNEMVTQMNSFGWLATDLQLRSRIRS